MHFEIEPGTTADYEALARYHYRAGPPATIDLVLRAAYGAGRGETVGVLTVSRPVLNAPWREALWPGVFAAAGSQRDRAKLLNRHLRTISRVIVDPRYRGIGLATQLVRAYLQSPRTPRTEAVAAMSAFCEFFAAAGMREVVLTPSRRDRRLRRALREAGLQPWRLVDPGRILRLSARRRGPLDAALRRWANDSRATRSAARGDLEVIIAHAARAIASPWPSRAYGFDSASVDPAAATGSGAGGSGADASAADDDDRSRLAAAEPARAGRSAPPCAGHLDPGAGAG